MKITNSIGVYVPTLRFFCLNCPTVELLRGGCDPSPKREQSQCDDNKKPHPVAKGSDLSKRPVFSRGHFEVRIWNTMPLFL